MTEWLPIAKEVVEGLDELKVFKGLLNKKKVPNAERVFNESVLKLGPIGAKAGATFAITHVATWISKNADDILESNEFSLEGLLCRPAGPVLDHID